MLKNRYWLLLLFTVFLISCNQRRNNKIPTVDYNLLIAARIQEITEDNDHATLQDQKVYWGNDTVNIYMLSDFVAQQILFFYFSENTCSPCVEQSINIISKYIPDYLTTNQVVFMSPDCIPRFRENRYGKRLLGLENKELGIQLEEESVPFFFTINGEMKINDLHIVNKNDFEKTSEYLNYLTSKFKFTNI